jgi:hypothetical protein
MDEFKDSDDLDKEDKQLECLKKCMEHEGFTACEAIWTGRRRSTSGCYAHTLPIAGGSGSANHRCFLKTGGVVEEGPKAPKWVKKDSVDDAEGGHARTAVLLAFVSLTI